MKNKIILLMLFMFTFAMNGQDTPKIDKETLIKEYAGSACSCIDSIAIYNTSNEEVSKKVHDCIDKQIVSYQMILKISEASEMMKDTTKQTINITINSDSDSDDYKRYYYELERYLMKNCKALKRRIGTNNKKNEKSVSDNPEAVKWYNKGIKESENTHFEKAIKYYKKAVKLDPNFAFAWDNMGLAYRKLKKYNKAIIAYNKSLEIDPKGKTPLQNIAVVHVYTKEYDKAIEAYNKLAKLDNQNPEVYYGIGTVYFLYKNDNEKGLQNMCKAYNLYAEQKSPYRTDAEKIINHIYVKMKKNGNEKRFNEILKENHIIEE